MANFHTHNAPISGLPPMLTETLATAVSFRRRQSSKSEIGKFSPIRFRRHFRQAAKMTVLQLPHLQNLLHISQYLF